MHDISRTYKIQRLQIPLRDFFVRTVGTGLWMSATVHSLLVANVRVNRLDAAGPVRAERSGAVLNELLGILFIR